MKIKTKKGEVTLYPADEQVLQTFRRCWPMSFRYDTDATAYEIAVQTDAREIWGIRLAGISTGEEVARGWHKLRKDLVPLALAAVAKNVGGVFIVSPFIQNLGNDFFEHGLALFPALGDSAAENASRLILTPATRDELLKDWFIEKKPSVIMDFMNVYRDILRSLGEREYFGVPTVCPFATVGDCSFDFMACDGQLVSLQLQPQSDAGGLTLLKECGVKGAFHMPARVTAEIADPAYKITAEDLLVSTAARIDMRSADVEILLPDLVGSVVPSKLSIGWDGCVEFQPAGIRQTCRVDPHNLRKLGRHAISDDVKRNRQLWANRVAIAQENLGWHDLLLVGEKIVSYAEVLRQLELALRQAIREAKANAKPPMIAGVKKPLLRCLKSLRNSPHAELAEKSIAAILADTSAAHLLATATEIAALFKIEPAGAKKPEWAPPTGGPVPFIDDRTLRRKKLIMLYHIVCKLSHDRVYTRSEIDEIILATNGGNGGKSGSIVNNCRYVGNLRCGNEIKMNDSCYHVDTLRRNLIDIGYLNRDPHNDIYWLQPSKASQPATT